MHNIKEEHKLRVTQVYQYIDDNLDSDLSLEKIASIALVSPFYFHRLFKLIAGETLLKYITRRRIEGSALQLIHTDDPIADIFSKFGFQDISSFSRTFKKFYEVSPTEFRNQNLHKFSKIRQLHSKNGQAYPTLEKYICIIEEHKKWITMNASIEIKNMPEMNVAYISVMGPENVPAAYGKIIQWATPLGRIDKDTRMATVYHDSFKVTEAHNVRMSACIVLNQPADPSGEIWMKSIDAARCIVGRFEIGIHEFEKSWTGLFIWMNDNGYKKAEQDPYELYHNDYNTHPEKKFIVDFCIPVE